MIYKKIVLEGDQKVFFSSDFHYGHKNICRGTTTWDLKEHGGHESVRDFDTLEQMNTALVDGINKIVGPDDWLVDVGDWSFGGIQNIWNFRKKIVCKNVIKVLGNHDEKIALNKHLPNSDLGTYAQDVFESVHGRLSLTVSGPNGKNTYEICHFPMAVWDKGHHGRKHLYGHVHGNYQSPGRALDVGVDNAFKMFGEYRPFTEKEVLKYMEGREYVQMSHHNKNTN